MILSDNGPSNNSHLRARPGRWAEAEVQPLFTGNPDRYLSADFVLMLPSIYDVLRHLPWRSQDYTPFSLMVV